MNDPDKIVGLIAALMALLLASRNLRSRGLPANRMMLYGVVWVILISGLALIFAHFGARS